MYLLSAHSFRFDARGANYYYPGQRYAWPSQIKDAHGKQGKILPVPIYYTWVERYIVDKMPCLRAYALGGLELPTLWLLRGESIMLHYTTVLPLYLKVH